MRQLILINGLRNWGHYKLVPEFSELRYQVEFYPDAMQIDTQVWWTQVPHTVLEPIKLKYQVEFYPDHTAIYPSLVDSGTTYNTRAHEARVPSGIFTTQMPYRLIPEFCGLGYLTI